jgi:hypothetical protein
MRIKALTAAMAALLVVTLAAGCGKTGGTTPTDTGAPPSSSSPTASETPTPSNTGLSETEQKAILDAFGTLLKTPEKEKEALAELVKSLSKLSPENADKMLLAFEDYQNNAVNAGTPVTDTLVKLIQKNAGEPYNEKTLNDVSKIKDPDLKSALQALFDRGYKLIVPEGMHQAVVDYSAYKAFEPYVTKDIADYIEIKAMESESRALEDAAIIISIDEIYQRALACEGFIKAYPQSGKIEEIRRMYGSYVDSYFYGQNNTPAFDYETNKLTQEFLDSYKKAAAGSTDSPIAKAASDYLKVLGDNGYKLTDAVKADREQLTKSLKEN